MQLQQLRTKLKKSHVRVLAVTAETTKDGGARPEVLVNEFFRQFGKVCSVEVFLQIQSSLQQVGVTVEDVDSRHWTCTKVGMSEYVTIKTRHPNLLARTTTPEAPTLA